MYVYVKLHGILRGGGGRNVDVPNGGVGSSRAKRKPPSRLDLKTRIITTA